MRAGDVLGSVKSLSLSFKVELRELEVFSIVKREYWRRALIKRGDLTLKWSIFMVHLLIWI